MEFPIPAVFVTVSLSIIHCTLPVSVQVLNAVLHELNSKHNCFQDSLEAFCGNRIVEDKEECDCGFQRDCEEHGDKCCYPREVNQNMACKRKSNAWCRSVRIPL